MIKSFIVLLLSSLYVVAAPNVTPATSSFITPGDSITYFDGYYNRMTNNPGFALANWGFTTNAAQPGRSSQQIKDALTNEVLIWSNKPSPRIVSLLTGANDSLETAGHDVELIQNVSNIVQILKAFGFTPMVHCMLLQGGSVHGIDNATFAAGLTNYNNWVMSSPDIVYKVDNGNFLTYATLASGVTATYWIEAAGDQKHPTATPSGAAIGTNVVNVMTTNTTTSGPLIPAPFR